MSVEQNKTIADRLPLELSKGNLAVLDEVIDPRGVDHGLPPGLPQTREGTKQFFAGFRAAFPDLNYKIEDTIAEGDYVVQRVVGSGTMRGAFQGMPPSGKSAKVGRNPHRPIRQRKDRRALGQRRPVGNADPIRVRSTSERLVRIL